MKGNGEEVEAVCAPPADLIERWCSVLCERERESVKERNGKRECVASPTDDEVQS